MKKLVKIPFNHELIGKDGIVVKYRNGEEVKAIYILKDSRSTINYSKYPILSSSEGEGLIFHTLEGEYALDMESDNDLIMYQEVEVKEPKEVFIVETLSGEIVCTVQTIKQAENIIHHLAVTKNYKYKITKYIEVIEEGE